MATLTQEERPPLSVEEALVEADRCLDCGGAAGAPCTVACPAGIDVPGFIRSIADGDTERAAALIFEENLLGGTCARVCPVEELCEGACVVQHEGRPAIRIAQLQRFATDQAFGQDRPATSRPRWTGRRIAVVGAGPAGLVCAGELAARGHHVTLFEARGETGGLARFGIAPYRQQREPLPQETRAIAALGVEVVLGVEFALPDSLRELEAEYDAIFLGVGMGGDVDVSLPGDDLPEVWDSLPFIEALKTGAAPEVGDAVIVIGGGNTSIDVAREALRLGARDVTLLYRRSEAEMPAYAHEVAEARGEGVRFQWLTLPVRIVGDRRVEAVECRYVRLGQPDASGRRRPEPVEGTEFRIPADTVVKAIGQRPRSEFLSWIDGLELEGSRVKVEPETGRTSNPKYFAAGDAVTGGATVVEAVRTAKIAARGIHDQLLAGAP